MTNQIKWLATIMIVAGILSNIGCCQETINCENCPPVPSCTIEESDVVDWHSTEDDSDEKYSRGSGSNNASSSCKVHVTKKLECNCISNCDLENTVCCDDSNYKEIQLGDFIKYSKYYRDEDWHRTSSGVPYGGNKKVFRGTVGNRDVDNLNISEIDARFVDISIQEMENYICRVKNSNDFERDSINTLRFYYIKYDNALDTLELLGVSRDFAGKHSLAMLPVSLCENGRTKVEWAYEGDFDAGSESPYVLLFGTNTTGTASTQNHNNLCPGIPHCDENTILSDFDTY